MKQVLLALLVFPLFVMSSFVSEVSAQNYEENDPVLTAEGVVTEIYSLVSFEAGKIPDWEKVRSMFLDQATVVLRTARDATTVFNVDGFIQDFVNFVEQSPAGRQGFTEKILNMKPWIYGDMAHILVLYQAAITGSERPPTVGIDSFQLIKKDGRWWIVSITNELPIDGRSIPEELSG